jgi:NAD(P)-dependent dehydrogenase (short-subunit alcohol dehydrogenase family)
VVTGGGGGLGRAIGAALAGLGLRVWLADLDEVAAQRAADAVGSGVSGCALDVTDAEACRALAAQVQQDGGLAVWVNNAGVLFTRSSWEHPEREVRTMFDVNVHGTMNGTFAALEVMRPAGVGHVVNVVSLAGLAAPPGEAVYAATKHAALAFTTGTQQDLRADGVRGIHLSAVCPDGIWTPMLYDKVDDPSAAASWSGVLLTPSAWPRRSPAWCSDRGRSPACRAGGAGCAASTAPRRGSRWPPGRCCSPSPGATRRPSRRAIRARRGRRGAWDSVSTCSCRSSPATRGPGGSSWTPVTIT